ncbi:SPASM domain-containing protein [bacterium]|jgi:hypothetical protein|nr:SPASM domain-containing protein [bacterium]
MLTPKCKLRANSPLVIRHDGYVNPCCHFGLGAWREAQAIVGDKLWQLHISNGTLDEINRSEAMQLIEKSIYSDNPMKRCVEVCTPKNKDTLTGKETLNNVPIRTKKLR